MSAGQVRPSRVAMASQSAVLQAVPAKYVKRLLVSGVSGSDPELRQSVGEYAELTGKGGLMSVLRDGMATDLTPTLATLRVPTTVACGSKDRFNLRAAHEMAESIPGAVLEIVPGAGHLWNLEMPEDFNALVRKTTATDVQRHDAG